MTSILVVRGYFSKEEDGSQDIKRDPNLLTGLFKRHTIPRKWIGYRRMPRRARIPRYPWRLRTTQNSPPVSSPTTKANNPPTANPDICRNHTMVLRVEDEPGPVVCLRRSKQELLLQLESVGGFVKRYTAINETDACRFEDLAMFPKGEQNAPKKSEHTTKPTKLPTARKHVRDQHPADQGEYDFKLQRLKRSLPTSPGTFRRGCQGRGTIPDKTSRHRLCTECSATTRLAEDRFPNFINEVICDDSDHQCAAKMGVCVQRTLQLDFLRFDNKFEHDIQLSIQTGKTVYRQVWQKYTQEIKSCCECQMYSHIYHLIASRDDGDDGDDGDDDDDDDDDDRKR